jgi:DNA modification methylase
MIRKEVTIGDCRLILGDCLEVLPLLDPVDAVVTDPPYGISVPSVRRGGQVEAWDASTAERAVVQAIGMADSSIVFGGNYYSLPPSRCWLVWDKMISEGLNLAHAELAWTNLDHVGVRLRRHLWSGPFRQGNEKRDGHPTQKPVELMKWCLGFLPDARTILDPFMGSGSTGVACAMTGRSFIGIELDEGYFNIACERIRRAYGQLDLFIDYRAPRAPQAVQQAFLLEAAE